VQMMESESYKLVINDVNAASELCSAVASAD